MYLEQDGPASGLAGPLLPHTGGTNIEHNSDQVQNQMNFEQNQVQVHPSYEVFILLFYGKGAENTAQRGEERAEEGRGGEGMNVEWD